ncbi:Ribosomal RNA small subunit methyltransferase I [bacterium HR39]|nr:Ribosomal RNA small subunit methyltransferase I [bacterium HR39]
MIDPREPAAEPRDGARPAQPQPGLWVVATPIGHLGDLSPRAREILERADIVLCEDTRVTGRMLERLGIRRPLESYHEHNAPRVRPRILARLKEGASVALVSDAGTPGISDPGYRLVREAREAGIPVRAVPGPSAVIAALSVAGLPTDRFLFAGFLPARRTARRRVLEELGAVRATLVFYEAPHRIGETLRDVLEVLGDREAAIARELTKLHEEVRTGRVSELLARIEAEGPPKGEMVLLVGPPGERERPSEEDVAAALDEALASLSVRDAAAEIARRFGISRREAYRLALERARARKG